MRTKRLLYVDDVVEIGELVQIFFEQRFPAYEVLLATSAAEALQKLRSARENAKLPNAIAVDVNMCVSEDGITLVEAVRAEFPKIRTVLVSGSGRLPGQDMPAHGFVMKGGAATEYVERIFELLQCPTDELPPVRQRPNLRE